MHATGEEKLGLGEATNSIEGKNLKVTVGNKLHGSIPYRTGAKG